MGLCIVLLAAGQGKRMKTTKPKPLVELADKPLIQYSLDTAMKLNPERIVLVTGHKRDEVKKYVLGNNPGDYVFGDIDGVICIPKEIIDDVINQAEEVKEKEDIVRGELSAGKNIRDLFEKYKVF